MTRPCGDHLVTSRPKKKLPTFDQNALTRHSYFKITSFTFVRDIVSKICYCRSYRSLFVTGFDRNGLVPYSNASSTKAIIWSDFEIITIASFALEILQSVARPLVKQNSCTFWSPSVMHFTRFSESKKACRSDTLQKRAIRWPWFYYHFSWKINFLQFSVGDLFIVTLCYTYWWMSRKNKSGFSSQFYPNFWVKLFA